MTGSVNRVFLIGNLGEDPRLHRGGSAPLLNMSLATSETWLDKDKVRRERTEWHRIAMFGGEAEEISRSFRKGSRVHVEGSLRSRSYEKNGRQIWVTEVMADRVIGA